MNRKHITIYDIAREAEVSPATVSRILTGSAKVREDKYNRVMALIEKYSFSPNAMARSLSETHSRVIGMVLADAGNPYYNSVFSACVDEAYRRGYSVMMYNTLSRAELEDAALNKLQEQRVDVIIICGGRVDLSFPDAAFSRLLEKLRQTTPIVVASKSRWEGICGVAIDHEKSMDLAMDYLLELGHRRIGFVYAGPQYYGTEEKIDRFRDRMARAGLAARQDWLVGIPGYDCESGRDAIDRLMAMADRPTALLGLNDVIAAGMLQGLLGHGVRIPEEMSLMGFDDTFIAQITSPHLTAVKYDYGKFAQMLVDAALAAATGEKRPMNQLMAPSLSVRQSCASPAGPGNDKISSNNSEKCPKWLDSF